MRSRRLYSGMISPGTPPARAALAALAFVLASAGCEDMYVRPGSSSILEIVSGPTPSEASEWAIDRYDANKRYRGTVFLANQSFAGDPIYIKLFTDNAADKDAGVRMASIRALGTHGGPEHAAIFIAAMKDPDRLVRVEAARALQRVYNTGAIPVLIAAMNEKNEPEADVRAEAADALGQYAERRVLTELIRTLTDPNLAVNYSTLASLRTLTGQDFGFDRVAWRAWTEKTSDPFKARSAYVYPVFRRDRSWVEYLPLVSQPPNEPEGSTPAGAPPIGSD